MSEQTAVQLDKPSKFHGYSVMPTHITSLGDVRPCGNKAVQLHIGRLPERKGLCLYVAETNNLCAHITPLAYFKTEEAAIAMQKVLDWLILKIEPK